MSNSARAKGNQVERMDKMKKFCFVFAAALSVAALMAPAASAQTVNVVGAGSSAMWQEAGLGAFGLTSSAGGHYTVGGNCGDGTPVAKLVDSRAPSIGPEGGNLWVVWTPDLSQVWAYISVDSTVGNRVFFAVPRATLALGCAEGLPAGQNRISSALWGVDNALPDPVAAALNGASITTAFTDIRPEDAKFAEDFVFNVYGTSSVLSNFSSATATPVEFNISGTDPFTGQPVPNFTTIPVGASPVVFIQNRTNPSGLGDGAYTDISAANAALIFSGGYSGNAGANCTGQVINPGAPDNPSLTVLLREPLSGTMNTAEFTTFAAGGRGFPTQELGVSTNPLNQACAGGIGVFLRGIGTGEIVSGVRNNTDAIGYAFFGYGNFSSIAGNPNYGYLTLDGIDPIMSTTTDGTLPTCSAPCPVAGGTSFPHVRDGSYEAWSVLRAVTDAAGIAATTTLVNSMQSSVNATVPDFIPYNGNGADEPGLQLYRSHRTLSGFASGNPPPVGPGESGGDVGGCIRPLTDPFPGVLECTQ
jgi:ABC-type phosphate transport system substrate-binding protein